VRLGEEGFTSTTQPSRKRGWFVAFVPGAIAGATATLALAMDVPRATVIPIGFIVWWSVRNRSLYVGVAGFLVGLGLGLGLGSLMGASRCAALNTAGGYCAGPDLATVGLIVAGPLILAGVFVILGLARAR
jgi:hypothetical protein